MTYGVEQRNHVHVSVFSIVAGVSVDCGSVHDGEVELLIGSAELNHEIEHLIDRAVGIGVRTIDLVDHDNDPQATLESMGQNESSLRLGSFVGVYDEKGAVRPC